MFQFFKFYLSALPPLPLSEHSLPVSFLASSFLLHYKPRNVTDFQKTTEVRERHGMDPSLKAPRAHPADILTSDFHPSKL
jgi:hypothetical protein